LGKPFVRLLNAGWICPPDHEEEVRMERGFLELRHLNGFVAVAEERNFGRAAERLHMTQPPLSRLIRQLEDHLGVSLFDRNPTGVAMTDAGRAFLEEAVGVLGQAERAVRVARQAGRGELGRLRVGHVSSASLEFLTPVLASFHGKAPGVRITVRESTTAALLHALRANEIDAALVRSPVHGDDLDSELMHEEDLLVALPAHHPLARRRQVPLTALCDQRFIVFPRASGPVHDHVLSLCRRAGFEPTIAEEAHPASSMVLLVAAGCGIALVPAFVQHDFCPPGVVYRNLGPDVPPLGLSLAWRCHENSPTVRSLVDLARQSRSQRRHLPFEPSHGS